MPAMRRRRARSAKAGVGASAWATGPEATRMASLLASGLRPVLVFGLSCRVSYAPTSVPERLFPPLALRAQVVQGQVG